ncbi:solute carrier family 22 member 15-like [Lineus longissimus]|uniref:solute carrier family 22 member 15-like n=1 Tax=Lineus longissimus TaxID=88925 RepID=UPI00315D45D5
MNMDRRNSENRAPIFEDIFELIGHIGTTQVCMYLIACVIEVAVSLSVLFYSLEYANPGWTCLEVSNSSDTLITQNGTGNETGIWTSGNLTENVCPLTNSSCVNLTYSDEYTSISTEWNLICDRRYIGRLTASLYFVGVLLGACISGQLSDTFGRKKTILMMWTSLIISQTCTGVVPDWEFYLPLRILAGVFAGGCSTVALILPMEYLGPKYRILTSNRIGWQIGGMLVALIGYLTRSWRKTALAAGLLTLPFVPLFHFFIPESARWLIQKGRVEEAKLWIKRIAKYNRRPPPDLSVLDKIAEAEDARMHMQERYTYLDLFRTKKYAVRSLVLMLGWFDVSILAYGIGADMEMLTGNIYFNMAITSVLMISLRWTVIPIANRIGRRKTYLLSKIGVMVCLLVVMILAIMDHERFGTVITGMVLTSFVCQAGVWCMVFIYPSEAYPTLLRTRATALGNMSARMAGIVAPQVGLLSQYHTSGPYVLYLVIAFVTLILFYGIMPETNGKPLPEDLPPHGGKKPDQNGATQSEEVEMLRVDSREP